MTEKTFIIGDVHGNPKTLDELLNGICNISDQDRLIFLGDLMDKGPDSRGVLDIILNLQNGIRELIIIRGNHEQLFLDSINNAKLLREWFRNGGKETLDSFEVYNPGFIEDKYIELISNSIPYYLTDDFVITHAGLNFEIQNPLNDTRKMQTIRNEYCNREKIGNRCIIVGHTPVPLEKIKLSLREDKIMLDGGCVYHRKVQGLGYLAALELNSMELFFLQNIDS